MDTSIELICANEFFRLLSRGSQYLYIVVSMYLRSLYSYGNARLLRATYCFFRNLDDTLDNDRSSSIPPVEYVIKLKRELESECYEKNCSMSVIAAYMMKVFKSRYSNYPEIKFLMLELIDILLKDRYRMENRALTESKTMWELITRQLQIAVDISLIISKSKIRSCDVQELIRAQGIFYTLRDLQTDYENGIINLPAEIYPEHGSGPILPFEEVITRINVRDWLACELESGGRNLCEAKKFLETIADKRSKYILMPLYKGLTLFKKRYKNIDVLIRKKYGIK